MPKESFSVKSFSTDVKDYDDSKGIVVAYANAYNVKDRDGDISAPGSFDKTVKENWNEIFVYKNHDDNILVGLPIEIDTKDAYGLLTKTEFSLDTTDGKDMYQDVKFRQSKGRPTYLSIGYNVMKRDNHNKSIIKEYMLGEYSFLTKRAANPLSVVQEIKSYNKRLTLIKNIEEMYNLKYSDKRLREIETVLKSLDKEPESDLSTPTEEPIAELISKMYQLNLS